MRERLGQSVPTRRAAPAGRASAGPHRVRELQRALGNRAMGRLVRQTLQRDLTKEETLKEGKFKPDLKTQSNAGAKSGMKGTVTFTPDAKAPDSTKIRLYQAVRLEDLTTGKDFVWTGANSGRTGAQTAADTTKGIEAGWWIDVDASKVKPRTAKADAEVSPYYRDYWANASSSQDGSKAGATIKHASLWDYPGWSKNCRYTFQTVAVATDTGHVYGALKWGFTISDAPKGTVDKEHQSATDAPSATTVEALRRHHEYYKNPGSSTAPT
jgi:hypothetical protein